MDFEFYNGYQTGFLGMEIGLPNFTAYENEIAAVAGNADGEAKYVNYSAVLSTARKLPIFTASNIDGKAFQKAPRKDNWRKDSRIDQNNQLGKELYSAPKSDFDKGHMTKREDVQWGDSIAIASLAADSTFYYSNAVPQHADLNQKIWRSLEDYILHTEAKENDLRIAVFTGPVLHKDDPEFVTKVKENTIQIPVLFWKIVYFKKSNGELFRVGFMMNQNTLLIENGIVASRLELELAEEDNLFMQFADADTYQVNVGTIESLTNLKFAAAKEPFTDDRKLKLIMEEIDVHESFLESTDPYQEMGFRIGNISF